MAAEAALSKSLDELIAEQAASRKQKQQKKEVRRGNRPSEGDRAPRRASGGAPAPRREPRNLSITVKNTGGGIAKPRRRSAGGPVERDDDRQRPEQRLAALEGDAKWGHDLYRGPPAGRSGAVGGGRRGPRDPRDPTTLGTKLFIENLHFDVTDSDIKELFETCGPLVKHGVHYDNSGRSEGTAEVIYKEAADAERAMRRYNNVQLDGQPMQIELIAQAAPGAAGGSGGPRTLSSGIRISGERGGTRMVQLTRHFQQAAGGATRVRGRGSVRSGVAAMQE